MTTINRVRVLSIDGSRISYHVDHVYGWDWNWQLVSSRTLALRFLWEPISGYFSTLFHPTSGEIRGEELKQLACSTSFWMEVKMQDFLDEPWIQANVGRFISCVGMEDRQHFDEMWNDPNHEGWLDPGVSSETKKNPKATYNIAVTDPKWLSHLSAGMEWDSTASDCDVKVVINPTWLTSTVLALANGIYQEKAFDRMPILADALQDAGCDNEDILNHCRQPGEHVKGCFVVDLLLGKS
jgi:hypothetical protein